MAEDNDDRIRVLWRQVYEYLDNPPPRPKRQRNHYFFEQRHMMITGHWPTPNEDYHGKPEPEGTKPPNVKGFTTVGKVLKRSREPGEEG